MGKLIGMSGYVDYDRATAKCAYEAFRRASEEHKPDVDARDDWDQLAPEQQNAWIAAVIAVRERESERATKF